MTDQPSPYSEGTTLGRLLTDAEREQLRDAEETVQCLAAELEALREAARAVFAMNYVRPCEVCERLATVCDIDAFFCEEHVPPTCVDRQDMLYASAWRRLVEMVKP